MEAVNSGKKGTAYRAQMECQLGAGKTAQVLGRWKGYWPMVYIRDEETIDISDFSF